MYKFTYSKGFSDHFETKIVMEESFRNTHETISIIICIVRRKANIWTGI